MCGIAGFHVKDPSVIKKHEAVELFVDELFKGIESRGKHATGFVSVGVNGTLVLDKAPKEATKFIKDRERIPEGVRTVLLHTRWATLGSQENQENNHPVVFGSCFATHNGHINNHEEVYEELSLQRNAEVDSSVIAAAANFHGIGAVDDIRSTLEAMEGAMACAIINPVESPGRVILARGSSSPLYVVDTPKFVVWSSTMASIKDAWGAVLGTPPADNKIERIEEGNFIVIDDGEVTRDTFTVKKRPFGFGSRQGATRQTTGTTLGRNGSGFGSIRSKLETLGEKPVVVQAREEIAEFIKAGGTARHFDAQQNGLYDPEDDFKDVTGNNKWHPCYGCNRLILEQDLVKHAEWGTICIDCVIAVSRALTKAENEMQDTLAGTTVPRISPGDRDGLEVWADYEQRIHREVLDELSKECGSYYSAQAIEFLVFFTTPEYREVAGAAVNALITELREAYEVCYFDTVAQTFEGIEEGIACEVKTPKTPLLLEAGATDWRFCHEHNKAYTKPEGCDVCRREGELEGEARLAAMLDGGVEVEPETKAAATTTEGIYLPFERGRESVITNSARSHQRSSGGAKESEDGDGGTDEGGEIIELPLCGNCGTYVLRATESSCTVCRESEKNEGTNGGPFCVGCTSPDPNYAVGYAGRNYYYCRSCYKECGSLVKEPDNTVHLCHEASNHMRKDGVRVCHRHARRQSEILSDTTLRKRGATITEV